MCGLRRPWSTLAGTRPILGQGSAGSSLLGRRGEAVAVSDVVDQEFLVHRPARSGAVHAAGRRAPAVHGEGADRGAEGLLDVAGLGEVPRALGWGAEPEADMRVVEALDQDPQWPGGQDRFGHVSSEAHAQAAAGERPVPLGLRVVLDARSPHAEGPALL